MFYGYKAHTVSDAYYGIPLYQRVRPANEHESPHLPEDVGAMLDAHLWLSLPALTVGLSAPPSVCILSEVALARCC